MTDKNFGNDFEQERDRIHLEMMSAVSHDLKTPLASIIGSLEIHNKMASVLSADKKAALLSTAVEEAYRLDGFISNILDMARLDNKMIQVHNRVYDVQSIIQDCTSKIINRFPEAIVHIHKQKESIECNTDASLLSRALYCLIENAIKHGNKDPVVDVRYHIQDKDIVIDVQDNGAGVAEEYYQTIFDKYTRLAKKDYKNAGTGLGLTISTAIAKLLGGSLFITPHENESFSGAWFTIRLPQKLDT